MEMKELLQLTEFVDRVRWVAHLQSTTKTRQLKPCTLTYVVQPAAVTHFDSLVAKFVCQQFRANKPVTCKLLLAIFDPEANKVRPANDRSVHYSRPSLSRSRAVAYSSLDLMLVGFADFYGTGDATNASIWFRHRRIHFCGYDGAYSRSIRHLLACGLILGMNPLSCSIHFDT